MRVIFTGAAGMLGKALTRLAAETSPGLVLVPLTRADCDLEDAPALRSFLARHPADAIVHGAAFVGGIQANISDPVRFLSANLRINLNVIEAALAAGIGKLMFIGSSCMYPKDYTNPLKEEYLLAAPLEPTNEGYALSKIVGAKHCEYIARQHGLAYRSIVPCNLYGPGDNFDPVSSHLVPSIIRKVSEAIDRGSDSIEIWGDGTARREFMYVDDLAAFVLWALPRLGELPGLLNVGPGVDHNVTEYYAAVARIVDFRGRFTYDPSKPVGMRQKLLDVTRLSGLGWRARIGLDDGLTRTYRWYRESLAA